MDACIAQGGGNSQAIELSFVCLAAGAKQIFQGAQIYSSIPALRSLSEISGHMNSRAGECFDISHTLSDANRNQGESIEQLNQNDDIRAKRGKIFKRRK